MCCDTLCLCVSELSTLGESCVHVYVWVNACVFVETDSEAKQNMTCDNVTCCMLRVSRDSPNSDTCGQNGRLHDLN